MKELIIVQNGMLIATLHGLELNSWFEKFRAPTSIGLNSILKHNQQNLGRSHFKVSAQRQSQIIKIEIELLLQLTGKFPELDRQMQAATKFIELEGIPICDFYINHDGQLENRMRLQEERRLELIHQQKKETKKFYTMLQMKGGKQVKNSKPVQINSNLLENSTCDIPELQSEMEELDENNKENDKDYDSDLNESC